MPITKYENVTLEKQSFVLEECYFVNCVLKECEIFYSGGDADWMNLRFENCRWHWHGAAGKTFQLLVNLGMLKTQGMPLQMTASSTKLPN